MVDAGSEPTYAEKIRVSPPPPPPPPPRDPGRESCLLYFICVLAVVWLSASCVSFSWCRGLRYFLVVLTYLKWLLKIVKLSSSYLPSVLCCPIRSIENYFVKYICKHSATMIDVVRFISGSSQNMSKAKMEISIPGGGSVIHYSLKI